MAICLRAGAHYCADLATAAASHWSLSAGFQPQSNGLEANGVGFKTCSKLAAATALRLLLIGMNLNCYYYYYYYCYSSAARLALFGELAHIIMVRAGLGRRLVMMIAMMMMMMTPSVRRLQRFRDRFEHRKLERQLSGLARRFAGSNNSARSLKPSSAANSGLLGNQPTTAKQASEHRTGNRTGTSTAQNSASSQWNQRNELKSSQPRNFLGILFCLLEK